MKPEYAVWWWSDTDPPELTGLQLVESLDAVEHMRELMGRQRINGMAIEEIAVLADPKTGNVAADGWRELLARIQALQSIYPSE